MLIDLLICTLKQKSLVRAFKKSDFFNKKFKCATPRYSKNPIKNEVYSNRFFSALPEYLKYADKISMKFSLEVRVPFLDYRMVDVADSFDEHDYIKGGVAKYTLRESVKNIVPYSVYSRKDKKGFFTPHSIWLKSSLSKSIDLEVNDIIENGLFNFIDESKVLDYYKRNGVDQKVWRLYCLSRWKKVWSIQC